MLDKEFISYLEEEVELESHSPDVQDKFRVVFERLGLAEHNQYFVDFWSTYSDEIYGEEGHLVDLAIDLGDFENSLTACARRDMDLPEQYISFLNDELDDFLFYDISTDEVFLVEAPNIEAFVESAEYDEKWSSFEEFIKAFLGYQE